MWKMQMEALLIKNDAWMYVNGEYTKPPVVANDADSENLCFCCGRGGKCIYASPGPRSRGSVGLSLFIGHYSTKNPLFMHRSAMTEFPGGTRFRINPPGFLRRLGFYALLLIRASLVLCDCVYVCSCMFGVREDECLSCVYVKGRVSEWKCV